MSSSATLRSLSPAALIFTLSMAPSTAERAIRAPTPASDTELGLPWAAIAFTMSKTFTDAFIVRRGTCVA